MNLNLLEIGWSDFFKKHFEVFAKHGFLPARVACERKNVYTVYIENGELDAEVSGKFRFDARAPSDFPAIGDWVAISVREEENRAIIHGLLPRKTCFSRKMALTRAAEQVLAANIDIVFLVSGMDREFNVRRIERYLTLCYDGDYKPIIVLNKLDLLADVEEKIREVESIAFKVPIHPMSALKNTNVEMLRTYLTVGKTAAFFGSSGVGKSTIINRLLGEERQIVKSTSTSTGKGKHVTVHRELIPIPTGGLLIDTPGMRELQLWGDEDDVKASFADIEDLGQHCRFRDCRHESEPGCAVKKAVREDVLDVKRYKNYLKLKKELRFVATRRKERQYLSKQETRSKITEKRKGLFK